MNNKRKSLPFGYEEKYQSETLKENIAKQGMWSMIPAVKGSISSKDGKRRLEQNDLLFTFIDHYFPNDQYAFEPNMQDGRFVFLPYNVVHQGIGLTVSAEIPGYIDVNQFWYPGDYTEKITQIGMGQVCTVIYSQRPNDDLAAMVRRVYRTKYPEKCCTFPFSRDIVVKLEGDFMDHLEDSALTIRNALKNANADTKRTGEEFIRFIKLVRKTL